MFKYNNDNRYNHIEKVQRELMNQHKQLESQLNQLKMNLTNFCNDNGINCYDLGHRDLLIDKRMV
ncbi:hypothetical protein [Diatraea saccharalis granulovirus]|uniref:Uncharacterized protein n=1 Tax=Diatraea saccharalis granulovirus TaxID=1675862 RepID=A0A0R7EYT8_9BBAC|nr:hypothetical protein [Diatraea saccharalis granulovirus]AKN80746.1 hypothetical protein [Diatraea saccharalis granulovirus]